MNKIIFIFSLIVFSALYFHFQPLSWAGESESMAVGDSVSEMGEVSKEAEEQSEVGNMDTNAPDDSALITDDAEPSKN